jgi:glycine/D-amino acid oxidase-like deaminating enzyme
LARLPGDAPDIVVLDDGTPPAAPLDAAQIADEAIACRCEGVTAARIRAVGGSAIAAKRATRAGMGACGGRLCAAIVGALCGEADAVWDTPRPPVRPVPASAILRPVPDPHPPVWDAQIFPAAHGIDLAAAALDCDVAVIGGGVVGLSTALYLARAGRDVVLLDAGEPGQGASSANAGSLHVQLLPYTFSASDPGPLASILTLGPASIALWQQLAGDAGEDLGIRLRGGLVLALDPADLDLLERKAAFERSRGVSVEVIGPDEVARLSPGLAPVFGAAWCAAEGQIDPLRGTPALLALACRAGVRILGHAQPQELVLDGAAWRIATARASVRAGQVVNAAGIGAVGVARLAGAELPVRTVVQQVVATARAPEQHLPLVAVAGRHLSLKQNHGGQLLVGGAWPGMLQPDGRATVLRASLEGNLALAASVLPMLAGVDVVRAWATPTVHLDRGPVLSETPGMPGLWHAVVSNGYTLGPGVGHLMAEALLGREALPAAFAL